MFIFRFGMDRVSTRLESSDFRVYPSSTLLKKLELRARGFEARTFPLMASIRYCLSLSGLGPFWPRSIPNSDCIHSFLTHYLFLLLGWLRLAKMKGVNDASHDHKKCNNSLSLSFSLALSLSHTHSHTLPLSLAKWSQMKNSLPTKRRLRDILKMLPTSWVFLPPKKSPRGENLMELTNIGALNFFST